MSRSPNLFAKNKRGFDVWVRFYMLFEILKFTSTFFITKMIWERELWSVLLAREEKVSGM